MICTFTWATERKRIVIRYDSDNGTYAVERGWRDHDDGYLRQSEFKTTEGDSYLDPEDVLDLIDDLRDGNKQERCGYYDAFDWLLTTMQKIDIGELRIGGL